jgi:hypothetical protein
MTVLHASSTVARVAWKFAQLINQAVPEGKLPTPAWSKAPLQKKKERQLFFELKTGLVGKASSRTQEKSTLIRNQTRTGWPPT